MNRYDFIFLSGLLLTAIDSVWIFENRLSYTDSGAPAWAGLILMMGYALMGAGLAGLYKK